MITSERHHRSLAPTQYEGYDVDGEKGLITRGGKPVELNYNYGHFFVGGSRAASIMLNAYSLVKQYEEIYYLNGDRMDLRFKNLVFQTLNDSSVYLQDELQGCRWKSVRLDEGTLVEVSDQGQIKYGGKLVKGEASHVQFNIQCISVALAGSRHDVGQLVRKAFFTDIDTIVRVTNIMSDNSVENFRRATKYDLDNHQSISWGLNKEKWGR